ncbi:MAG: Fic family protein [Coriobacteriaceae bacterium]|nr:Fic family protein [Coriobacteriaceae bacterium]
MNRVKNREDSKGQWPACSFETLPWVRNPDELSMIPKSARRKIGQTYQAAIPCKIAGRSVDVPTDLSARISDLSVAIARFDMEQKQRGYDLPALMLRSESAASSQIEHLTSSVRNVALAEVSQDVPQNARLIAGNVAAMRTALSINDDVTIDSIREVHRVLMVQGGESFGGELRSEQVWVGGSAYSPHGALYVPPAWERVEECLDDMIKFAARDDIDPVVQAAVMHAQFESIHPFIDGNGRTGRALLHKMLRKSGILFQTSLPVSAGLLHNIDAYMDSIVAYQQGDPIPVVEQLADALELALAVGKIVARDIDGVMEEWSETIRERAGSSIHRLPAVLAEQPVVNVAFVAERLGITTRAASSLVARACDYGILRPMGNRQRGEFYQSDQLIDVLEEASSLPGIRRLLRGQPARRPLAR